MSGRPYQKTVLEPKTYWFCGKEKGDGPCRHLTKETAERCLKRGGITTADRETRRRLRIQRKAKMLRRFMAGESLNAIAADEGVSGCCVKNHILDILDWVLQEYDPKVLRVHEGTRQDGTRYYLYIYKGSDIRKNAELIEGLLDRYEDKHLFTEGVDRA